MALFALDHNYPAPIIEQAKPYLSSVELVYIEEIDRRLTELEDWELLLALHHHPREWDGMISNDTSMLDQERELALLGYTHLTLVAPVAVGHDPIRSTGRVLAHIEDIASRTTPRKPQVWRLGQDVAHDCIAELVPEPTNPHDPNAIMVKVEGRCVGYLSRQNAVKFGPRIKAMIEAGKPTICNAFIGCKPDTGNPNLGVSLEVML